LRSEDEADASMIKNMGWIFSRSFDNITIISLSVAASRAH